MCVHERGHTVRTHSLSLNGHRFTRKQSKNLCRRGVPPTGRLIGREMTTLAQGRETTSERSDVILPCVHSGELPFEVPLQGDVAKVAAVPVDRF